VREAGRVVSREEIRRQLWSDNTFVDFERGTNFCVSQIRAVLGNSAEKPRYIQTLPRRGYRFIAPLNGHDQINKPSEPSVVVPPSDTPGNGNSAGHGLPISETQVERTSLQNKWPTLGLVAVPVAVIAVFLIVRHGRITPNEPRLTRLTANSIEDPVTSGAVSPDGKYLAYTDKARRIRVEVIATGEVQSLPQLLVNDKKTDWEIGPWFSDSTRFLVNAHRSGAPPADLTHSDLQGASIWVVSLVPESMQKLRDEAWAMSIRPDDSLIVFGASAGEFGDREVWVMDASGQHARKLFDDSGPNAITALKSSLDGQRIVTFERNNNSGAIVAREMKTGSVTSLVRFSDATNLGDFAWLPDGRLIYSSNGAPDGQCGFWKLQVDPRTGKPVGKPQEILNVHGFCVGSITVTADAKRLTFRRWLHEDTTYLADLSADGALTTSSVRIRKERTQSAGQAAPPRPSVEPA
jgi:Tol biopolymer transport system component